MEEWSDKKVKKAFTIEKSMASGIDLLIRGLMDSKKLSKHEINYLSMLIDEPFLGEYLKTKLGLIKDKKGWIAKKLEKFWKPFTRAFQSIWYNKRVQKALKKSQAKLW